MKPIKISDFANNKISESDVVKRVLSGEKELYEILIRRNNQKLFRVIRSYIRDTAEIEDLMQNTYLKAYEKLFQFNHTSAFSTWLIRIGINEALARLKEKGKIYNLNDRTQIFESNSILEMPDINQLNPESKIIRQEAKLLLENAIDSLEPKYRTVYMLKDVEEMSIKEISECLNISVSNVKVRHHRAKNMLKDKLYEHSVNGEIFQFGFHRCDKITDNVMRLII